MSVLDEEISSVVSTGRRNSGVDDSDEDDDENCESNSNGRCSCRGKDEQTKKKKKAGGGIGFSRNLGKAKQVVLYPFTKAKNQLHRRNNNTRAAASSCSSFASGKRFGAIGGNRGCYFCFTQPLTVESSVGPVSSDPNSPNFTYGKLRALIEKNDFYSKECNPHFDFEFEF